MPIGRQTHALTLSPAVFALVIASGLKLIVIVVVAAVGVKITSRGRQLIATTLLPVLAANDMPQKYKVL